MNHRLTEFYELAALFDNNLYIMAFAMHYYCYKETSIATVREWVEMQRFKKIDEGMETLLDLKLSQIRDFKSIFWCLNEDDEYDAYLKCYCKFKG